MDPAAAQRPEVSTFFKGDGLPNSAILDLDQDASGRLWILSRAGFTLYDGRSFTPAPRAGLPDQELSAFEIDAEGRAWAVTRWIGPHVYRLDATAWVELPPSPPAAPEEQFTSLAVGTRGERTLVAIGSPAAGLRTWDGDAWTLWSRAEGLPSDAVASLAAVDGAFAVGTRAGLCHLRGGALDCAARARDPRLAEPILALARVPASDGSSSLWILSESWLGRLRGSSLTVVAEVGLTVPKPNPSLGAITAGPARGIYFGTVDQAFFLDTEARSPSPLGVREGLAAEGATVLFPDRESNVWVGSLRGLSRIGSRRFVSYTRSQGLLDDEVTAVLELGPDRLLLGHNRGLTFLDGGKSAGVLKFSAADTGPLNECRVLDMARDLDGTVWVAANFLGLLRLDGDRTLHPALGGRDVYSVELDARGRLWASGHNKLYLREAAGSPWTEEAVPEMSYVRWLTAAPDGRLYLSTVHGLGWREDGEWRLARGPTPEASNVFGILAEPSGTVWAGTRAGLYRLEGERLVAVTGAGMAVESPVYFILRDGSGRHWLGTDDGVLVRDGDTWRRLTTRHGLAGRETNRGAALVDRQGRVWIGTIGGLSHYQPRYERPRAATPQVELTAVEVNGVKRPLGDGIELSHRENTLTFPVETVALTREDAVVIRYRLEPFEREWMQPPPGSPTEIRYTNLPVGRYLFRVAAGWDRNAAGTHGDGEAVWGPDVVSPPIVIRGPYWRSPWFFVLAATAVTGAVLLAHGLRVRALRASNAELNRYVAERQKLIAELEMRNTELERFTYTVSHDLKSPLVTIRGFVGHLKKDMAASDLERARRDLELIESAAGEMGRLLDELLELSRVGRVMSTPHEFSMTDLAQEAVELLAALISSRGVTVDVEPGMPSVVADRLRVREVMQNLIENAVKYTGNERRGRVRVGMRREAGGVVFFVADNGAGIDARYHEKIFGLFERLDTTEEGTGVGLALVKRIVELHGGRIWVESEGDGRGSTFCFTLPSLADSRQSSRAKRRWA